MMEKSRKAKNRQSTSCQIIFWRLVLFEFWHRLISLLHVLQPYISLLLNLHWPWLTSRLIIWIQLIDWMNLLIVLTERCHSYISCFHLFIPGAAPFQTLFRELFLAGRRSSSVPHYRVRQEVFQVSKIIFPRDKHPVTMVAVVTRSAPLRLRPPGSNTYPKQPNRRRRWRRSERVAIVFDLGVVVVVDVCDRGLVRGRRRQVRTADDVWPSAGRHQRGGRGRGRRREDQGIGMIEVPGDVGGVSHGQVVFLGKGPVTWWTRPRFDRVRESPVTRVSVFLPLHLVKRHMCTRETNEKREYRPHPALHSAHIK